ncbi:uncharacterized protein N7483_000669 [Penicillium malachiteum]|uniref:uncharacterized protein n=1 Tax=Penicillium malachiteum TaxID=1324776 RepID=UPI002548555C|nr:uncharacterized protein N7483_000669 [Penicillium malachiteum]KAJ5735544.1 hypothetical protein N7483_000669 [Penicillium malachiteum]
MVTSSIDANPLDPNTMHKYGQTSSQTHKLNDLDMIIERNVAPSPQAMCAELAHQHALEDLHDMTEHTSEQSNSASRTEQNKDASSTRRSSEQGAEPRKPEE